MQAGAWVEVRSAAEIVATLDGAGAVNGVPFMPEMAAFVGRRMRIHRRADKTCVEGHGMRALGGAVLLDEVRCDGAAHDGCQRGCLMFWAEAWLRPQSESTPVPNHFEEAAALKALRALPTRDGDRYVCQSTALAAATRPLPMHGLLVDDFRAGELSAPAFAGMAVRTVINKARRVAGKPELGQITGHSGQAPRGDLGLRPGEWVRIKSAAEVKKTVGPDGKNRGLSFEPEMTRHIGAAYQVGERIERIILEESGRMVTLRNTVSLKDVNCTGSCVKNCPRANPLFWRETWLERVHEPAAIPLAAE
jgi:hypothetical protein